MPITFSTFVVKWKMKISALNSLNLKCYNRKCTHFRYTDFDFLCIFITYLFLLQERNENNLEVKLCKMCHWGSRSINNEWKYTCQNVHNPFLKHQLLWMPLLGSEQVNENLIGSKMCYQTILVYILVIILIFSCDFISRKFVASQHTLNHHVCFLSLKSDVGKPNKMSQKFLFSSNHT